MERAGLQPLPGEVLGVDPRYSLGSR